MIKQLLLSQGRGYTVGLLLKLVAMITGTFNQETRELSCSTNSRVSHSWKAHLIGLSARGGGQGS